MALVCSRRKCFLSLLVESLIISTLNPLVSGFSSFQLVDGVVEFLHREWLQRVLVLFVPVLVFVHLRR